MIRVFQKLKIILLLAISFANIFLIANVVFAENLGLTYMYGIDNVAKNGRQLPLELNIENKDSKKFEGYVHISVFESNECVYVYKTNFDIEAKSSVIINENISIANKANTIIIEVFNLKEELIVSERTNIDLSYYSDKLIIGVLTKDFASLKYIDEVPVNNNALRTKIVEVSDELISHNRNILDQLDVLLISDYNMTDITETFSFAINEFIKSGKPTIIALGGNNGIYSLPNLLEGFLTGPTIEGADTVAFADENGESLLSKYCNVTYIDLADSKKVKYLNEKLAIELFSTDNYCVLCLPFSLNSLDNLSNNSKVFAYIIDSAIGKNRLDKIVNASNTFASNDFYTTSNILNMIEKQKLPDIFVLTIMLVLYISLLTIIIYVFLRNINKRQIYGRVAFCFSIVFTAIMVIFGYNSMKKNTSMTFMSLVDIRDESTKEKAYLNFRTGEAGSYSFNTSANNKFYPMVKVSNAPIVSSNFMSLFSIKSIGFEQNENRTNISVDNAKSFDANLFAYENSNYLNNVYNISCSFNRMNGDVTGRVTNNMDKKIYDASILLYGKVVKIGDIDPKHSVALTRCQKISVPVANNAMLSEILASGNNQSIIRYYLGEKVSEYYEYGEFFGFIDDNDTLDIKSDSVGDIYGKTLLIRRILPEKENERVDVCSLENEVVNVSGYYDSVDNSINGDSDVVNTYSFDNELKISSIYYEEIDNYDRGNLNYNATFYGNIYALNLDTGDYDLLQNKTINDENIKRYLSPDNKISIKFSPTSRDPLYRKISLPIFRAIGSRK